MCKCEMCFTLYPYGDEKTSCVLPRGHKGNHLGRLGGTFIGWQLYKYEIVTTKEAVLRCGDSNKKIKSFHT